MDIVWAPWRMQFILGEKQMGCFLCEAAKTGASKETLVLRQTPHSLVILNRYPYIAGHLMVTPIAHVSSLDDLSPEQFADLHETMRDCVSTVKSSVSPDGINVGMNMGKAAGAGVEDHLHYHVIPRFVGDSNAFSVLGEIRVIPEDLEATYDRYFPHFSGD